MKTLLQIAIMLGPLFVADLSRSSFNLIKVLPHNPEWESRVKVECRTNVHVYGSYEFKGSLVTNVALSTNYTGTIQLGDQFYEVYFWQGEWSLMGTGARHIKALKRPLGSGVNAPYP